jgi:hypothetical protein
MNSLWCLAVYMRGHLYSRNRLPEYKQDKKILQINNIVIEVFFHSICLEYVLAA